MKKKSILNSSLITYFVMLMLFVLLRLFISMVSLPLSDTATDVIFTLIIQGGLMFCLSIFMFSALARQKTSITFKQFGYNKIGFLPIILCVVIGIACYILNTFVASFFSSIISLLGYERVPSVPSSTADYSFLAFLLQVFIVAILPAIGEETAHRGLLLHGMSKLGIMKALLFSSLLFGLMHMNVNQFFYATILGFIIGVAVIISKSIWPGIIIHFMNNYLSTYFSFAMQNGNRWPLGNFTEWLSSMLYGDGSIFSLFIRSVLFMALILGLIVFLFVRLLRHTRIKKVENMLHDISSINGELDGEADGVKNGELSYNMNSINKIMGEYNIKSVGHMIFTDLEEMYHKPSILEQACLISCIVLGSFVTISTFIWGVL